MIESKKSILRWLIAVRPWSFPASAMPVIVSIIFLYWKGYDVNFVLGVWGLLTIVLFHAASNAWSDYFDFKYGVDTPDTYGSKTLTDGLLSSRQVVLLSVTLNLIAIFSGLLLVKMSGLELLWIGLAGVVCSLAYPYLKYHALGDLDIMMAYAFLPAIGTSFVAVGQIDWQTMLVIVPVGFITVAILHANNTRDIATDQRAGITTLSMILGKRNSVILYAMWIISPLAFIIIYVGIGILPVWSLITCIATPIIYANIAAARHPEKILNLDEHTAQLQLIFSLLLSISLFIAKIL